MDSLANNDYFKKHSMEMLKLSEQYHGVFNSPHGEKVLEDLKQQCEGSCLSGNGMFDINVSLNPNDFMMLREGQNSVIRYIERMITFCKNKENR